MAIRSGTEGRDRQHVAGREHDPEPHADTGQRDEEGQSHRHHGPERQQHDDDRGGDPDALARARRGRDTTLSAGVPPTATWQAGAREAECGVDDVLGRRVGQFSASVVSNCDDRESGPAVGRQLVAGTRRQRAGHRSRRAAAVRTADTRLAMLRASWPLVSGCAECITMSTVAPAWRRKARAEQVLRLLRGQRGRGVVVGEAAAEARQRSRSARPPPPARPTTTARRWR